MTVDRIFFAGSISRLIHQRGYGIEGGSNMGNKDKRILVIGATGQQGGAVVRALQNTEFAISALVRRHAPRDKRSGKIRQLEHQGVQIVHGDLDDVDSLVHAMAEVYGVFGVTTFQDRGVMVEEERGK